MIVFIDENALRVSASAKAPSSVKLALLLGLFLYRKKNPISKKIRIYIYYPKLQRISDIPLSPLTD
jgi:hypothetical protein